MDGPNWLFRVVVDQTHEEQLAEHGGSPGVRDENALESALARPKNLYAYGCDDLYEMAASLAYGLACNHPFTDGNKRTALALTETFLAINGLPLLIDPEPEIDRYIVFRALASGYLNEASLAELLKGQNREVLVPLTFIVFEDMDKSGEQIPELLHDAFEAWCLMNKMSLEGQLTSE